MEYICDTNLQIKDAVVIPDDETEHYDSPFEVGIDLIYQGQSVHSSARPQMVINFPESNNLALASGAAEDAQESLIRVEDPARKIVGLAPLCLEAGALTFKLLNEQSMRELHEGNVAVIGWLLMNSEAVHITSSLEPAGRTAAGAAPMLYVRSTRPIERYKDNGRSDPLDTRVALHARGVTQTYTSNVYAPPQDDGFANYVRRRVTD